MSGRKNAEKHDLARARNAAPAEASRIPDLFDDRTRP